jgi:hypothetical protein
MKNGYKIVVRKSESKRLGARHRWDYSIKIHLKEIRCEGVGRIELLVVECSDGLFEHGNKHLGPIKCGKILHHVSDRYLGLSVSAHLA